MLLMQMPFLLAVMQQNNVYMFDFKLFDSTLAMFIELEIHFSLRGASPYQYL